MQRFQVAVFGKQGCDKCEVLKKRLNKILEEKEYACFEFSYFDLGTVEGLVRFCQYEILNPQRIPSFVISGHVSSDSGGKIVPLRQFRKVSDLEGIEVPLALETDYGKSGVITPQDIRKLLDQAREMIPAEV